MPLIRKFLYICILFSSPAFSTCLIAENIKGVNIRAEANSSSELVGKISRGEKYVIVDKSASGNWLNFWYDDDAWWAYNNAHFDTQQGPCIELEQAQQVTRSASNTAQIIGTAKAGSIWAIHTSSESWHQIWYAGEIAFLKNNSNNSPPRMLSTPNDSTFIDMQYSYQPITSSNENVTWQILQGPTGSEIESGILYWKAQSDDFGTHSFALKGTFDNAEIIEQSFDVTVKANEEAACKVVEGIKGVNVRAQKASSSTKLGFLNQGEHYTLIEEDGNWSNIWFEGQNAWVYSKGYVIKGGDRCIAINNNTQVKTYPDHSTDNYANISTGVTIPVVQEINDWYQVRWHQAYGFIAKSDSRELGDTETRVFVSTPNQEAFVNTTFRYAPRLDNSDNVVFQLSQSPTGMLIDQGVITWQPSEADIGDHEVKITASFLGRNEQEQTFNISVKPAEQGSCSLFEAVKGVNIRASNSGSSANVGYFDIGEQYSMVERRGNWVSFWFDGAPRWAYAQGYLNDGKGTCATISNQADVLNLDEQVVGNAPVGSQWVILHQTNEYIETWFDGDIGRINKLAIQDIEAPEFTSSPNNKAYVGTTYEYIPALNKPNNVTFKLIEYPQGMEIANGVISWHPTNLDVGNHLVVVSASYPDSDDIIQTFDLEVSSIEKNACELVESIKGVNIRASNSGSSRKVGYFDIGEQYSLVERRGDWVSFWFDGSPRWAYMIGYINEEQGECVTLQAQTPIENVNGGIAGYAKSGSQWVISHQTTDYIETWFNGEVGRIKKTSLSNDVERRFLSVPNRQTYINTSFRYAPKLNNNQDVTFQLTAAPIGMELIEGVITWLPNSEDIGSHQIRITASYPEKNDLSQTFSLEVKQLDENTCSIFEGVKGVNVRTSNSGSSALVGYFNIAQQYTLIKREGNWANFWYDGTPRWAYANGYLNQGQGICAIVKEHTSVYDLDGQTIGSAPNESRWVVLHQTNEYIETWFDGKLGRLNKASIQIENSNDSYEFTSVPNTQALVAQQYTYSLTVNHGGTTEFSLVKAPSGMEINQNVISWTPTDSNIGQSTIVVSALIGVQEIYQSFIIEVSAPFPLCSRFNLIGMQIAQYTE